MNISPVELNTITQCDPRIAPTLNLSGNNFQNDPYNTALMNFIGKAKNLTDLDLSYNCLSNVQNLIGALPNTLKRLDLSFNILMDLHTRSIADLLKANNTETLILKSCDLNFLVTSNLQSLVYHDFLLI